LLLPFIEGPNDKAFRFWDVKEFPTTLPIAHTFSKFEAMEYLEDKTIADLFRAEKAATEIALTEAGRPNATVTVEKINEESLGYLFMFSKYLHAYSEKFYEFVVFA